MTGWTTCVVRRPSVDLAFLPARLRSAYEFKSTRDDGLVGRSQLRHSWPLTMGHAAKPDVTLGESPLEDIGRA